MKEREVSKEVRPSPKEFAGVIITLLIPAVIIFIMILSLFGCKPVEPMYRITGDNRTMEYINRKGELIVVPLNSNECEGYRNPYHKVMYNKNVGGN